LLAREYGFDTYAVDLWSDPVENRAFFDSLGISRDTIHPVKADASQGLPFEHDYFDAVVSIDSYNYYGRDPHYLGERLLPYVKQGGMLYLSIPGMVRDCHDNLPVCLLKSWTPEQLDYMHDIAWWRAMIEPTPGVEIVSMQPMLCTDEAWKDWLACDNEYAAGDRAAVEAGALEYLNTIAIVLRKL
ncbi:MAG: class I SAM-dependent methyltransferase, partial [Collinsella sp.]|nr:class I SAM-dependent methyltransferase [Collinsella sp.]